MRQLPQRAGFAGEALTFRHDELASFPLTGRHRDVACSECHERGDVRGRAAVVFRGLGRDCAACHADPHGGSTSSVDCASCHSTAAWVGDAVTFDHQRVERFPLDATHRALACGACHASGQTFAADGVQCADCHADVVGFMRAELAAPKEDEAPRASPHSERVQCADCHDSTVARQSETSYAQRCANCHNARYATLFLDRNAHLRGLALRVGKPREELEALLRAGSHNYLEVERRLRARVDR